MIWILLITYIIKHLSNSCTWTVFYVSILIYITICSVDRVHSWIYLRDNVCSVICFSHNLSILYNLAKTKLIIRNSHYILWLIRSFYNCSISSLNSNREICAQIAVLFSFSLTPYSIIKEIIFSIFSTHGRRFLTSSADSIRINRISCFIIILISKARRITIIYNCVVAPAIITCTKNASNEAVSK